MIVTKTTNEYQIWRHCLKTNSFARVSAISKKFSKIKTIASTVSLMHKKGYLFRQTEGKFYLYAANPNCPPPQQRDASKGEPEWVASQTRLASRAGLFKSLISGDYLARARLAECAPLVRV